MDVSINKPIDFDHTDWYKLVHKTKMSRRVKARDEISPQLKHLRQTLFSVASFNNSIRKERKDVPKEAESIVTPKSQSDAYDYLRPETQLSENNNVSSKY